ncbi:histone-lysine N-methyltransferase SMYD3-like [Strongylocentrotus purpuratus]|uniref:SET domain-containing protein n=1 Tax=Strongylocentrotus purpuratus TaxID=7668 RepID=A0A7M7PL39_STRPU|nr:histone-lysine N-methyltransferase SMYD3-like [Strongylocentrotus purpuratus]
MSISEKEEDWTRCHEQECIALKRIRPDEVPGESAQVLSQIIRKQEESAPCTQDGGDCFPTTVDQLESHHEKLSSNSTKEKFKLLLKHFIDEGVLADIELTSLIKMNGAIRCNTFSALDYDLNEVATSMANHSCDPNCAAVYDGRKLQLRTIKNVEKGDEALDPNDGLAEKLQGLEIFEKQTQDAKSTQLLELYMTNLKVMDSSSCLPAHHHLVVEHRCTAFEACIHKKSWEKAAEIGLLITEPYRVYYGPYHPQLGIHLLKMGKVQHQLRKLQEARKYLTEAESVLKVTHGPQHSLMASVKKLLFKCR